MLLPRWREFLSIRRRGRSRRESVKRKLVCNKTSAVGAARCALGSEAACTLFGYDDRRRTVRLVIGIAADKIVVMFLEI